jgi:hypothetical protein
VGDAEPQCLRDLACAEQSAYRCIARFAVDSVVILEDIQEREVGRARCLPIRLSSPELPGELRVLGSQLGRYACDLAECDLALKR